MAMFPIRRAVPVKGMNTVVPARSMSEEFSPVIENVWYNDGVTMRRRLCHAVWNTTVVPTAPVKDIFEYKYNATNVRFIKDSSGLISIDNGTGYTSQAILFTGEIGSSSLKNLMIVGDGIATAQVFNGSTWAVPTVAPNATGGIGDATIGNIFHNHKGRCYAAGNTALPMTIFVSDTFTSLGLNYWDNLTTSAGSLGYTIDVSGDLSTGDIITGITTHRGSLIVFCRNHILVYSITESAASGYNTAIIKAISGEGCISNKSIQQVGEETIFLSPNGFKRLSVSLIQGDSQVNDLSSPINNEVKDTLNGGGVVEADIRSTYNPRYGIYLCTLGTVQWAYQTSFQSWFRWVGVNRAIFTDSNLTTFSCGTYMCTLTHTVFRDELSPGSYTQVQERWTPAPFRSPSPENKPRWRKAELVYESNVSTNNVTIGSFKDEDFSGKTEVTYALSTAEVLENGLYSGRIEVPLSGRSEIISIDVKNNETSDFRLKIIEVYMNDGGIR